MQPEHLKRKNSIMKQINIIITALLVATACGPTAQNPSTQLSTNQTQGNQKMGLIIEELTKGTGSEAVKGKTITVHYTGWLTDGTKFDSSLDRGQPFTVKLGAGEVIKGWDEGFAGMRVGGKRKLTIPPELGYGSRAVGGVIPANATLIFEVELLDVRD